MNVTRVKSGLDQLWRSFHSILESDSLAVIEQAKVQVERTKRAFDEYSKRSDDPKLEPRPWGYQIHAEKPLRFRVAVPTDGFDAQIDLFCKILWRQEDLPPVTQEIGLRLWHMELCYRDRWDSLKVQEELNNSTAYGRVMLRCHFDLANEKQAGPEYHLQFGGSPHGNELFWLPELINLPRFAYPPMDLILVSQLVAANFFPDVYNAELKKDSEWKHILISSQRHLLEAYYSSCLKQIQEDKILLDHLWNN